MNNKFFTSLNRLLSEGRVSRVINVLRKYCRQGLADHPDLEKLQVRLERVAETYSRMRDFLLSGFPDPDREKICRSVADDLRDIAREYAFISNENRLDPFYADYRLQKVRRRSLADMADELAKADYRLTMAEVTEADTLQFVRKKEELLSGIFRKVWSLPPGQEEDIDKVREILASPEAPFEVRSQLISALLLGLLKFYDPYKFLVLLGAYDNFDDERLEARALTAIVLVLHRWGNAVTENVNVVSALESLADSIITYTRLREVVMILIRTRDTDRVSREVSDAFSSTMNKLTPDLLDKLRKEGMATDASETGLNPEWEKLMKESDLEQKMQAINDMQLEGMDVMMQTFARLKSFPFFNTLPNWFLPFSPDHSAVSRLFSNFSADAFKAMKEATDMCANDCYSFALGIMQMPEERRRMLASHFSSQLEALNDLAKDRENVRRKPVFSTEVLLFARDIYRFAKLYPKRNDFFDPFEEPIDFASLAVVGNLLSEDEVKLAAADFYFRHGYYSLALPFYSDVARGGEANRSLFERIGFCFQMEGDIAAALENYEKADLFSSDEDRSSTWLIKKLAFCHKALGNYARAAEHYAKLLELNPDDLNTEFHLGSVLLKAGDIDDGMARLSKVHYLKPDHRGASRAYVRGLIMRSSGSNFEEAFSAASALADQPNADATDFRLKAHAAFLTGRLPEAVSLYAKARGEKPMSDFRKEVIAELSGLAPFNLHTLQILLDFEE